ncbi:MAG: hypothetical protein F4Z12_05205 [Acidobacteria bacterium]|nr:hypothetical protein [Acidobacteriota bacterium]MYE94505.1 hypothetical protein [Gemmatimonadota bacterium]
MTVNLRISQTGDFLAPGEPGDKTFVMNTVDFYDGYVFNVNNDAVDEPDGTVTCTLLPGDGYAIGTLRSDTQPIRDDDPTTVTLSRVGSGAASEGGSVEFTVTLGRELVAGEIVDVPLDVSGGRPRGDWRLAKYNGSGFNTGVRLRPESYQIVSFEGAGARVASACSDAAARRRDGGRGDLHGRAPIGCVFDRSGYRTNVGGGGSACIAEQLQRAGERRRSPGGVHVLDELSASRLRVDHGRESGARGRGRDLHGACGPASAGRSGRGFRGVRHGGPQ